MPVVWWQLDVATTLVYGSCPESLSALLHLWVSCLITALVQLFMNVLEANIRLLPGEVIFRMASLKFPQRNSWRFVKPVKESKGGNHYLQAFLFHSIIKGFAFCSEFLSISFLSTLLGDFVLHYAVTIFITVETKGSWHLTMWLSKSEHACHVSLHMKKC